MLFRTHRGAMTTTTATAEVRMMKDTVDRAIAWRIIAHILDQRSSVITHHHPGSAGIPEPTDNDGFASLALGLALVLTHALGTGPTQFGMPSRF